jgi:hypothetical protein
VVSDGITTYKSNPYGEKTIVIFNDAYSRVAPQVLPYLRGPYSYVAPYVAKADELGDSGLSTIDTKFPIVKEDTETIKGSIKTTVFYPVKVAQDGKQYVFKTYSDEGSKIDGNGIFHLAKTVVSTELKIASDLLHFVAEWLGPKKEAAKKSVEERIDAMKK